MNLYAYVMNNPLKYLDAFGTTARVNIDNDRYNLFDDLDDSFNWGVENSNSNDLDYSFNWGVENSNSNNQINNQNGTLMAFNESREPGEMSDAGAYYGDAPNTIDFDFSIGKTKGVGVSIENNLFNARAGVFADLKVSMTEKGSLSLKGSYLVGMEYNINGFDEKTYGLSDSFTYPDSIDKNYIGKVTIHIKNYDIGLIYRKK